MVIGEAGESCAFHIASRLGMPPEMLAVARKAAYGDEYQTMSPGGRQKDGAAAGGHTPETPSAGNSNPASGAAAGKTVPPAPGIIKARPPRSTGSLTAKYSLGDSVMVYPDRKIGIVCAPVNEKGVLRVQLPGKKIWISHKRVKLHVAATELYPEDYDFSILFDK